MSTSILIDLFQGTQLDYTSLVSHAIRHPWYCGTMMYLFQPLYNYQESFMVSGRQQKPVLERPFSETHHRRFNSKDNENLCPSVHSNSGILATIFKPCHNCPPIVYHFTTRHKFECSRFVKTFHTTPSNHLTQWCMLESWSWDLIIQGRWLCQSAIGIPCSIKNLNLDFNSVTSCNHRVYPKF